MRSPEEQRRLQWFVTILFGLFGAIVFVGVAWRLGLVGMVTFLVVLLLSQTAAIVWTWRGLAWVERAQAPDALTPEIAARARRTGRRAAVIVTALFLAQLFIRRVITAPDDRPFVWRVVAFAAIALPVGIVAGLTLGRVVEYFSSQAARRRGE